MRTTIFILILFVTAASARAQGLSPSEIKEARTIYLGKCAKCHKLHDPLRYTDAEWDIWMRKMNRKARLSPKQAALLSQYLLGVRTQGMSTPDTPPAAGK